MGKAIALLPRMESKVTISEVRNVDGWIFLMRTYIVVTVLDKKRQSLPVQVLSSYIAGELTLGCNDVFQELAISEAPAGQGVDYGSALAVMFGDSLEYRQSGER